MSKTPPSYCEIYGLHISGRNKLSGQKRGYFTNSLSGFLLFLNKLQIVNSMAFKLPFLKGKCNSDGSLDCHGLPLFAWKQLRDKEEAIGRGSYGLIFVARNNSEKVVIKKLLGEDEKEKRLFFKEANILHGIKSEHIVRFQAVCMEPCAMMLEYSAAQKLSAVWTDFYNIFTLMSTRQSTNFHFEKRSPSKRR